MKPTIEQVKESIAYFKANEKCFQAKFIGYDHFLTLLALAEAHLNDSGKIYQCPRCATSMEIDLSAKHSSGHVKARGSIKIGSGHTGPCLEGCQCDIAKTLGTGLAKPMPEMPTMYIKPVEGMRERLEEILESYSAYCEERPADTSMGSIDQNEALDAIMSELAKEQ